VQTKLHINLAQGIIDVEGDVGLVREVYQDFKERLTAHSRTGVITEREAQEPAKADNDGQAVKQKRRTTSRKKAKPADDGAISANPDAPKLDKNLDTSKLKSFYDQFEPGSAPEKILIFLKYLVDELGVEMPNTDQVYTCFFALKEKAPSAFAQAFRDAANKKGFIEFNSAADIKITIMGENHFNHDLKKKAVE
jgi:hypothetical protein